MIRTLPIPGFASVVGFAVCGLSGGVVHLAPSLPLGLVNLVLFLLGNLLVGNAFFYVCIFLMISVIIIA